MFGFLTRQRYQYACMFVDHHYGFTCIHLLKSQTGDEAFESREYFWAYVESYGVDIKHHHAYNGIFRIAPWMNHCKDINQGLTFSGFNSCCQNGQEERRIRSLQDMTRCQMIHSNIQWPSEIRANLWPDAICHTAAIIN